MSVLVQIIQIVGATAEHGAEATEHTAEPGGIAALGIDPIAILAQAGTFLVLFFIIKKFALNKIVATLEARRQTIEDGVRLGRKMEAEHEQLETQVEAALQKARTEADKIIADGHKEAGALLKQAEENADRKVDAMLVDAQAKIEDNIADARTKLEREILGLVAEATEVIIEEKLDPAKDAVLMQKAIRNTKVGA